MLNEYSDYKQMQKQESNKGIIKTKKQVLAAKSHTCEKCGCEIPKGDYYWIYKPLPTKKFWYTWRKRCYDCEPKFYDEVNYYEDYNSRLRQVSLRIDYQKGLLQ